MLITPPDGWSPAAASSIAVTNVAAPVVLLIVYRPGVPASPRWFSTPQSVPAESKAIASMPSMVQEPLGSPEPPGFGMVTPVQVPNGPTTVATPVALFTVTRWSDPDPAMPLPPAML